MESEAVASFAEVLGARRRGARLTQEALAERAGVSVRSIQALESGTSQPQRDTARRLAAALGLRGEEQARFAAAAAVRPYRQGGAAARNLPTPVTSFIGRERELEEVTRLLLTRRMLTLTGSGGVGKTRLALAVAGNLVGHHPDGVLLVELAALAEPGLMPGSVAQVLGVREEVGRPLSATITDHLKEKHLLLVLDNCEHLVAACAALAGAILRACPHLHILATSREALEVAGEHRYRVPSLPFPNLAHLPPPEQLADSAAVALFLARAQDRRADFVLTAQNARALAQVCARLDGIPLAIELAAARVESLSVEGIAARLDDRFRLLTGGARDVLPRQRTLRAALDWSYDLLGEAEQMLLDRLSVFAGGCTLAAVTAVCAGEGVEGLGGHVNRLFAMGESGEVLDLLDSLVNKSLVQTEEAGGEVRYGLLETVRQYGLERLAAASGAERLRDRHLAWYLALAEEAEPRLWGAEQVLYYDQLERGHDNLRAALRWARERGTAEEGLRLAGALGHFWNTRGYIGEGRGWLEGALTAGEEGSAAARAKVLFQVGDLVNWHGDFGVAAARFEQALGLYRALDDTRGSAGSLSQLAVAMERQGDLARGTRLQEEALALLRELGDRVGAAGALNHLGWMAHLRGEYARAAAFCEESLALYREAGNREGVAHALSYLAHPVERQGAYARAVALQEEALPLWQAVGNRMGLAWSLTNLGWALLAQGEEERARACLEDSLVLTREVGDPWAVLPFALYNLGLAAYRRDEWEQARAFQEQALTLCKQWGYRWGIAWVLAALGCVVHAQGEDRQAGIYLRESLEISHAIGARGVLAEALEGMAWLTVAVGQAARATRLGGAADALRQALGAPLHPVLRGGHDQAVQAMQAALSDVAFTAAWAEGQALPLDEVVGLALENTDAMLHGQ